MEKDLLKPFRQHGIIFRGTSGQQAYGDCPFTGKQGKFYVNTRNQLWDSKTANLSGNLQKFLEEICVQNTKDITSEQMNRLAVNRGLPLSAFQNFEIGHSGSGYTFPNRDHQGNLVDLRMFKLGQKVMGTAGRPAFLFNLPEMINAPLTSPVYLCEGEWDTMAMVWLLKKLSVAAVAVGVPGATTFKREWADYFRNRDVIVCYDNDEAGEAGELIVQERLRGCAKSLQYLHWPAGLDSGFDVRDLVVKEAIKAKLPRRTFEVLNGYLKPSPRKQVTTLVEEIKGVKNVELDRGMTFEHVVSCYKKWLYLPNADVVAVAFATILSTEEKGDPIWMLLTASPGGCKSEIIQSFKKCSNVYNLSSLTPHALISGASFANGEDASVIPQIHGKCLCIKDFTVLINSKENDRDMVFATLRDAYDGHTSKRFGNNVHREYDSHFSILAGVTPLIYNFSAQHMSLGERFNKYFMGESIEHQYQDEIIDRAMSNVGKEVDMREEISSTVANYMEITLERVRKPGHKMPDIPPEIWERIKGLTKYASNLRGTVTRHWRNNDVVTGKPFTEIGTRNAKNIVKLIRWLAVARGHAVVTEDDYRIVRKMALDTVDQRAEELVRKLFIATPTLDDVISTKQLAILTGYNTATLSNVLNDLTLLGMIKRAGDLKKHEWTVSKPMRDTIKAAGIYLIKAERERVRADEEIFKTRQEAGGTRKVIVLKKKRA